MVLIESNPGLKRTRSDIGCDPGGRNIKIDVALHKSCPIDDRIRTVCADGAVTLFSRYCTCMTLRVSEEH